MSNVHPECRTELIEKVDFVSFFVYFQQDMDSHLGFLEQKKTLFNGPKIVKVMNFTSKLCPYSL